MTEQASQPLAISIAATRPGLLSPGSYVAPSPQRRILCERHETELTYCPVYGFRPRVACTKGLTTAIFYGCAGCLAYNRNALSRPCKAKAAPKRRPARPGGEAHACTARSRKAKSRRAAMPLASARWHQACSCCSICSRDRLWLAQSWRNSSRMAIMLSSTG